MRCAKAPHDQPRAANPQGKKAKTQKLQAMAPYTTATSRPISGGRIPWVFWAAPPRLGSPSKGGGVFVTLPDKRRLDSNLFGILLMSTEYPYLAFWGIGEVRKNGDIIDKPRLVHGMLTEYVHQGATSWPSITRSSPASAIST